MNKKLFFYVGICVTTLTSLALGITAMVKSFTNPSNDKIFNQFTMYVGYGEESKHDSSLEIVKNACFNHVDGCTIIDAEGYWKDGDVIYLDHTFAVYFDGTTLEVVEAIADEILAPLEQTCVLIDVYSNNSLFYYGK